MLQFLGFLIFSPIVFFAVAFVVTLIPFQIIKFFQNPKLNREWNNLHRLLPEIIYNENKGELFIKNIRNARYNPVFEFENKVEYINKRYNLKDISKLWILTNPFNFLQTHVILSFQFGENPFTASYLTLSYELRSAEVADFSGAKALYKLFEGYYILGTEEDLFYVRTNVRKNDGEYYLYPLNIEKEKLQKIFLNFIDKINDHSQKAYKYKVFSRNCLTETLGILRQEGVLNFKFYDYFFINRMIYKNKVVTDQNNSSFKDFLNKHIIINTGGLEANNTYSTGLRKLFVNRNHFLY